MWKALLPVIASCTQCPSSFCWLAQARRAGRFVFIINGRMHYSMFNVRCSTCPLVPRSGRRVFDVHLLYVLKVWMLIRIC